MSRLVFLGPPGVGKGTQAKKLAARLSVPHISTGDMLRDAVQQGTRLGVEAKAIMEKGELVPDRLVIGIVEERLSHPDCHQGWILDGFPRTVAQAEALEAMLKGRESSIQHVVSFQMPEVGLVGRIAGRRSCSACQAAYHMEYQPPKRVGICDHCGGGLVQRQDDREETVRERLSVYRQKTEPLIAYYQIRSLLRVVDANAGIDEVTHSVQRIIDGQPPGPLGRQSDHTKVS